MYIEWEVGMRSLNQIITLLIILANVTLMAAFEAVISVISLLAKTLKVVLAPFSFR